MDAGGGEAGSSWCPISDVVGWSQVVKYMSKLFLWVGGVPADCLLIDIYLLEMSLILGVGEYR